MDGCVEWQLAESGGLQIYRTEGATGTNVIVGVDDVDEFLAEAGVRGIAGESFDVPSGRFRLATLTDPAGNTVTIAQDHSLS